ncbi:MAG: flagellin lysine-N-methylase [Lachnospiraceae bacterium]|nr:flagellin lysine-N-methylase [Lachnospiraceae bacterium]
MTVKPVFYDSFHCKAARCEHTCCKGWEIDVDEDSALYYQTLNGILGQSMRSALAQDEDGYHFLLRDDRCPFLETDGLCRLIKELGEEALCDICALHPRFFEACGAVELQGLGLSCEAVCEELFKDETALSFTDETGAVYSISDVLARCGYSCAIPAYHPCEDTAALQSLLKRFAATDSIDRQWGKEISSLRVILAEGISARHLPETTPSIHLQNLFDYILFRQIEQIPTAGIAAVIQYATNCVDFIHLHTRITGHLAQSARRFSEQIEYSTVNVAALLSP